MLDPGWWRLVVGIQLRLLSLAWRPWPPAALSAGTASLLVVAIAVPAALQAAAAGKYHADAVSERIADPSRSDSFAERIENSAQPFAKCVQVAVDSDAGDTDAIAECFENPARTNSVADRFPVAAYSGDAKPDGDLAHP